MDKKVELHHRTAYRYERPVSMGPQVIQLRPSPHSATPVLSYALEVEPTDHILRWQHDPLGNHLARVIFPRKVSNFVVNVTLVADMTPINPFAFFLDPGFENYPFQYPDDLAQILRPTAPSHPPGRSSMRSFER